MKKYLYLFLLFNCFTLFAQQDNYSFMKLIVFNNENKIMLVKWDGEWEIPGMRYNSPKTLSKFINSLALEHGIEVENKKLNGMFTFEYENRATLTVMQYYTAYYKNGKLKVPESCEDINWFSIKETLEIIPYKEMKLILDKIITKPTVLWSGAIKKNGNATVEFVEDFYELK